MGTKLKFQILSFIEAILVVVLALAFAAFGSHITSTLPTGTDYIISTAIASLINVAWDRLVKPIFPSLVAPSTNS